MTMNDPTPLSAEQIDELISADLDGEFDAAARDLGFDPSSARAALDAAPGTDQRRATMRAARAHLGEVRDMDELLAARLRAKAVREAERDAPAAHTNRARWFGAMSAVAATIVIIAGVAFAMNRSTTAKNSNTAVKRAPVAGLVPRSPQFVGSLGEFADARGVVARARVDAAQSAQRSPGPNANSSAGAPTGSPLSCAVAAQRLAGVTSEPELASTATVAGAPVEVFVYRTSAEQIVVVTAPGPACRLVTHDVAPASSP